MSAFGIEIPKSQIVFIRGGTSKYDALNQLVDALATNPAITDREALRRAVHEREAVMSTGIGGGVAIPHVRIPEVTQPVVGVGIAPKGLEFQSLDNKPVYVIILFATPQEADKEYLGLLAQVMLALKDKNLYQSLLTCKTPADVARVLNAPLAANGTGG
jgi:mannitol/fructose-specific phosphotransferase system IIA component (Ntr-type)